MELRSGARPGSPWPSFPVPCSIFHSGLDLSAGAFESSSVPVGPSRYNAGMDQVPRGWSVPEADAGQAVAARDLALRLGVSAVTAQLLLRRGYSQPDAAREFLEPTLSRLVDPEGLPGMAAGA